MIVKTLETTPKDATHWSTRSMAREVGLTQSAVLRIWKAFGLQPHRQETWKLSKDPQFIAKVRDVVGLYLNPPERAVVLCVDEKSQIQALDRTAPILPMLPGTPSAPPTTTSAPAPQASTPPWTSRPARSSARLHGRHRAIEFKQFLQTIDREVPDRPRRPPGPRQQLDAQDAGDPDWLAAHPRFVLHFTPTSSSSWLNLVERWFAELTTKKLRRGAHRSVRALNADIRAWIDTWNHDPSPSSGPRPPTRSSTRSPATATNQRITTLGGARRRAAAPLQGACDTACCSSFSPPCCSCPPPRRPPTPTRRTARAWTGCPATSGS